MMLRALVLCVGASAASVRLLAQCPDGTPPPCGARVRAAATPAPTSVAVLYFDNLSRDTAFTYLADGVTEELITSLRRVGRLSVPSRNESARIRQAPAQPAASIARQLGVRYLLSGSVQPTGGRLRVNVELIEAATGRVIWGDRLIVTGSDPMAAQESIAVAVVSAVSGALRPDERRAFSRRPTRDSVAYDLYLRGRRAFDLGLTREAIDLFEQALERDSMFTSAAAGAAVAWGWMDDDVTPMVAQTEARLRAQRALRLDSTLAMAWTALAYAAFQGERDYDLAAVYARRAVALDSTASEPHGTLSSVALVRGRPGEGMAELALEWRLDSLSNATRTDLWHALYIRRDTTGLARLIEQIQRVDPAQTMLGDWRVDLAIMRGRCGEAVPLLEASSVGGDRRALALACAGQHAQARVLLDSLVLALRFTRTMSLAAIELALGNRDAALTWLERAVEARLWHAPFLDIDWQWESLRREPRYRALVRRLGLPDRWGR